MSRLNFANYIINKGFYVIDRSLCPVDCGPDFDYYRKDIVDKMKHDFAVCGSNGHFVIRHAPENADGKARKKPTCAVATPRNIGLRENL